MSYMLDEIREQPDVIRGLVAGERERVAEFAHEIGKKNVSFGMIAARGTSDNAATYGKYLFEIMNGLPIGLASPSVLILYGAKLRLENSLVVGISQSGRAADVTEYLDRSRRQGALTVCITNEPGSEITKVSDFAILCHAGKERSVAATKTYTSTLAALFLLNAALAGREDLIDGLLGAAGLVSELIDCCETDIERRAVRYRYMQDCVVLARGINRATAFEAALKLAETCYVNAEPFSSVDFLHGPIAIVEEGTPCFLYAPEGAALGSMADMARRLAEKRAEMIIISGNQEILSRATSPIYLPIKVDELLSPIVYIVVGQVFAHALAPAKGIDPDHPRGLSKVTITR